MLLYKLLVVRYTVDKTATTRQLFQDVGVEVTTAGLLVTQANDIVIFIPSHMLVSVKYVERKHFKAAEEDDDFKRQPA